MPDTNAPPSMRKAGKELGRSGTTIFAGYITNEEYNSNLTGKAAIRTYEIMRRSDSTIRQTLQVVKLPILSANWSLRAPQIDKDDPQYEAKQELANKKTRRIEHELFHRNLKFKKLIKSLLSALDFGFDIEEITLEITEFEGEVSVGIASVSKRKQTSLVKWETLEQKPGITQQLMGSDAVSGGFSQVSIPMEKLIVFSHDKEGDNYEGVSLLRYAYKDWDIKDKMTLVNAIALEKAAIPIPKIKTDGTGQPGATELDAAEEVAMNVRANEKSFIREPAGITIEFMDMKGQTTKEILPTLNYHDSRISKSVLAGFMDLGGSSGSGAQSLAKDLTSLFMKSEQALANDLKECIEEQLIKRLCDANFSDMSEGYPELVVTDIADDDIVGIATALSGMTTAGLITPDIELEDNIRDRFDLPAMAEEARADYEENKKISREAKINVTPQDKTALEKDTKTKKQKEEASVIRDAEDVQRRAIRVLFED